MGNVVAIVGRPNVGKSTLFNRLIGERKAIMDNESGVTRDRHYGYAHWGDKYFTVIDTGGYVHGSEDTFEAAIRSQVELAVQECDVVLFAVDSQQGLTPYDEEVANILRRFDKPLYIVANKTDIPAHELGATEFYTLGLSDKVWPVSAQTGYGTGDLLDQIITHFATDGEENPNEGIPRLTILGQPNVGKSSFVNLLLGTERNIVTEIAGTTRDAIDAHYKGFGKEFILTDTAGLRRKAKVKEDIEFYSVLRSIRTLDRTDVAVVMIDAQKGIVSQDVSIINLAIQRRRGIVILVNKWDLLEKDNHTMSQYSRSINEKLGQNAFIPIIYISVLDKQRIIKSMETVIEVYENMKQKIPTSQLNDKLQQDIERYPPPANKGKLINIKYITQIPGRVPSFAFFCNHPQYVKEPYLRYLENRLRHHFNLEGVPINVFMRKK